MFLDLGLKVGGVLVALVRGHLHLLVDPKLQLVSVPPVVNVVKLFYSSLTFRLIKLQFLSRASISGLV